MERPRSRRRLVRGEGADEHMSERTWRCVSERAQEATPAEGQDVAALLPAEEAGDLEIVRVVGGPLHRDRLTDAPLDADRGGLVVALDLATVAVERPLPLQLFEEVAIARE